GLGGGGVGGGGGVIAPDLRLLLQRVDQGPPARGDLGRRLGREDGEGDLLRPVGALAGGPRRQRQEAGGDGQDAEHRASVRHRGPPQMVIRRTRAETTSVSITMATMSRITVAASRSLKARMGAQRE